MAIRKISSRSLGDGAVASVDVDTNLDITGRLSGAEAGIGTTSPARMLHISGTAPAIALTDTETGVDTYITASSALGATYIQVDENAEGSAPVLGIKVGGNEIARFTPNGLAIGGAGVANTLEEYEEGTFTATIQDASGNSSSTTASLADYIRIGKHVTIRIYIVNFDTTGLVSSDDLRIYGLPFQSQQVSTGSILANYLTTNSSTTNGIVSYIANNTSYVSVWESRRGTSGTLSDVSYFSSGFADIMLTHTYFID